MREGPCVVTLATRQARHSRSLPRLLRSLKKVGFSGETLVWPPGSFPAGCPDQLSSPFAFKPFCLAEARERGFELVLWLDSSCLAMRPLDDLFAGIERRGYLLFRNREHRIGEWASDAALASFGLDREGAMHLPEVNAAAVGLNLADPVASDFLDRWHEAAREETAFRGVEEDAVTPTEYAAVKWNLSNRASADPRVRGHRHDQTVAGILAHRLGMELTATGLQPLRRGNYVVHRSTVIVKYDSWQKANVLRARVGHLLGRITRS